MIKSDYVFQTQKDAAIYLSKKLKNITPIKLQKGLYLLWAFYSATYGNIDIDQSEMKDQIDVYPKNLFPADFEAWKYGPVLSDIWRINKEEQLSEEDSPTTTISNEAMRENINTFLMDIIEQVESADDFGLVERTHRDSAWKNAYKEDDSHCKMDNDEIRNDYINYVKEQSEL